MEDIEDINFDLINLDKKGFQDASLVGEDEEPLGHPVKVHHSGSNGVNDEPSEYVPGVAKILVKTFGCSHNVSDSEYMEGALTTYGYIFTNDFEEADVLLINSCTVKGPSQTAMENLIIKGKAEGKRIVVSGCVPQADRSIKALENVSLVGVTQIDRIVEVVEHALNGYTMRLLGKKSLPKLDLPKVRKNKLVEIVPLSTGCLGSCTYCKTKHARGKLGSYAVETIISRIESVLREGQAKRSVDNNISSGSESSSKSVALAPTEFWLSSEDTGAYGIDLGTDIAYLLRRITSVLEKNGNPETMLRLGMTNPPYILAHLDQLAESLRHQNVFRFLHLPVQSGSNEILTAMNREYTIEQFCLVADYMLKHVPGLTLGTDIICGFPGETEEQFEETMALVRKYKFPVLHISQFYPRPGTPAAKMKRVDTKIVKNRSRRLTSFFESYTTHDHIVGKTIQVWVGDEVSSDGTCNVAHDRSYVKVLISPFDECLKGKLVQVSINEAHKFHVQGTIVDTKNE